MTPDQILSTEEVSEMTTIPAATLRFWRHRNDGTGPRSFRLGPRKVVYKRSDVEAWLEAQYAQAVGE